MAGYSIEEKNDIEIEEGNENVKNEIPFDPNDISINIVPRTIGQIVDMLRYGEILIPSYQRLPNLWSEKKKSRFIESLMLSLPIPLFYFDESEDKKWRVIDGLQRISTLEHFIILGDEQNQETKTISGNKQPLILQDLEFKTEFNGKKWSNLPRDVQRRIETNQVTINLIGKGTPDEVKYNIFSRINQGGEELTAQEIRTALFQGYRIDFIEKFVSDQTDAGKSFLKATNNSVSSKRQDDLDFATRFLSFYLLGYEEYEPDMDTFLTKGTKSIPTEPEQQEKILGNFQKAMDLSYNVFGKDDFRKTERVKFKFINKPLYEIISVKFAKLNHLQQEKLMQQKKNFRNDFSQLQQNDSFWDAITTSTASKDKVKKRHELFSDLLNKYTV
ncbi:MAG: DUF262 domain-containing protein [Candidatus Symbiothrix sp.]|jgi:hypothetical protein|nr:DUF262 domain-containing protein [Candidatus Symbiothrix sp.]